MVWVVVFVESSPEFMGRKGAREYAMTIGGTVPYESVRRGDTRYALDRVGIDVFDITVQIADISTQRADDQSCTDLGRLFEQLVDIEISIAANRTYGCNHPRHARRIHRDARMGDLDNNWARVALGLNDAEAHVCLDNISSTRVRAFTGEPDVIAGHVSVYLRR
jgi:hypothetical protein